MAFNSQYVQEQLRAGIEAHKAGDNMNARLHFQAALREDTTNIPALLWLAFIDNNFERQILLLEQVLTLDPENKRANEGLQWVKQQMAKAEAQSAQTSVEARSAQTGTTPLIGAAKPESLDDIKQQLETGEMKKQARKGTIAQRARRRMNPLIALLVGGVVVVSLVLWRLIFPAGEPSQAALAPFATATATTDRQPSTADRRLPTTDASQAAGSPAYLPTRLPAHLPTRTPTHLPTNTPTPPIPPPTDTPQPPTPTPTPLSLAYTPDYPGEKWIEVDLDAQAVIAWEGDTSVMSFAASTGLPNTPTVKGQFRIYQKLESTRMTGPEYDLPNVPYTMYFYQGYALHGTYWHNNFGRPMSHGCVNLSPEDAETLFVWAEPDLPQNVSNTYSSDNNPGTMVVVH